MQVTAVVHYFAYRDLRKIRFNAPRLFIAKSRITTLNYHSPIPFQTKSLPINHKKTAHCFQHAAFLFHTI